MHWEIENTIFELPTWQSSLIHNRFVAQYLYIHTYMSVTAGWCSYFLWFQLFSEWISLVLDDASQTICHIDTFFKYLSGVVVSVSDSWLRGHGFDSRPAHHHATTLLLIPKCLCHQALQFGTSQREGNRRSGVTLAMWHRLVVYPPTGLQPQRGR